MFLETGAWRFFSPEKEELLEMNGINFRVHDPPCLKMTQTSKKTWRECNKLCK